MSEYQYYEFLAVDRPLTETEQDEVREFSSRAAITATSFVNEYQGGDFRGDPGHLMRQYYDAHLYLANWGTHRIMLRMPCALLDPAVAANYCVDDQVAVSVAGEASPSRPTGQDDPGALAARIAGLPDGEKDRLLLLVAQDRGARVKLELLHGLRGDQDTGLGAEAGRTVGELLDAAALLRQ
jgi:hypothetical protein